MIALCDIGQSGLKSLQRAFEAAGFMAVITSSPEEISRCSHAVLSYGGSFASGFEALRKTRLDRTLRAAAAAAIRTGFIRVWRCFPLTQWVQTGKRRASFPPM